MSYSSRLRVKQTQSIWDTLNADEKVQQLDWCSISDQLIREQYPGQDIDTAVNKMSDIDFAAHIRKVLEIHRLRKKKKLQQLQEQISGKKQENAEDEQIETVEVQQHD